MEVIRGKQTVEMRPAEFRAMIAGYRRVVVDLGTGDGRFVYDMAAAHSDWFCIGVDAARENLAEYSGKIYRRPRRGGLPNALYVIASAESLPTELAGLADALYVNFPWGSLLEAILLADRQVLGSLRMISSCGASLTMLINTSIFHNPIPLRVQSLPGLTTEYIDSAMGPAYARAGIVIVDRRKLDEEEMLQVQTTWGRRLAYGKAAHTFCIAAVIGEQGLHEPIHCELG